MIVKAWTCKERPCKLVILGNYHASNPHHKRILNYESDNIIFPESIHQADAIDALRLHCKIYIHGHMVGGTNSSLVEALGAGNAVLAHDNVFNRYVAGKAACYFRDHIGLSELLDRLFSNDLDIDTCRTHARKQHHDHYRQDIIMKKYETLLIAL